MRPGKGLRRGHDNRFEQAEGQAVAEPRQEIEAALKALDEDARRDLDAARLLRELGMFDEKEINERLYLYFRQAGKSLYSGKPIDIARVASVDYCVDRILPRSVRRDESLDNKALVLYAESLIRRTRTSCPNPCRGRWRLSGCTCAAWAS